MSSRRAAPGRSKLFAGSVVRPGDHASHMLLAGTAKERRFTLLDRELRLALNYISARGPRLPEEPQEDRF